SIGVAARLAQRADRAVLRRGIEKGLEARGQHEPGPRRRKLPEQICEGLLQRVEGELAIAREAQRHAQHVVAMPPIERLESACGVVRAADVADLDELLVPELAVRALQVSSLSPGQWASPRCYS